MEKKSFDFSGWATRNDLQCSDGRTIRKNAFKDQDGLEVPLVWNHQHNSIDDVLGHALLENREDGVYAYCSFNETPNGKKGRIAVENGDVKALSINAGNLRQVGGEVLHGVIREVSIVLAGANPGAYIDNVVLSHSDDGFDEEESFTMATFVEEGLVINHACADSSDKKKTDTTSETKTSEKKDETSEKNEKQSNKEDDKNVKSIIESMNEEQQMVLCGLIGAAIREEREKKEDSKGGKDMSHNVFENESQTQTNVLTHSAQAEIIGIAKSKSVGSLQEAIKIYAEEHQNELSHGIDSIETLFPDFKNLNPGAPETLTNDQGWVSRVMTKVHKSPYARIKTRKADARTKTLLEQSLRAKGYKKGKKKTEMANIKLLGRSTDPQTVYVKDHLDRDDILDITDFDVVQYQHGLMRMALNEELATAIMFGDGRQDGDQDKIDPSHIRPIWTDDELYTIHYDVDVEAAKTELQGSNTNANFGENYIYAEAVITAALYSREEYKGSGTPDFYCTPHLLNVMLLARDMNGRRIYDSKSDLAAALNVNEIVTVEQMEGKVRTTADGKKKKLLGLFVNLADYTVGSTKGGEITKFEDFDIDFNQYKYLMETRVSGTLTNVLSAIALEEPVEELGA